MQELDLLIETFDKPFPLPAHSEIRMSQGAEVASVGFGRKDFVRRVCEDVKEAALRVVDKDQRGLHL